MNDADLKQLENELHLTEGYLVKHYKAGTLGAMFMVLVRKYAKELELRKTLREILSRFPDAKVLGSLVADTGLGHRRYSATFSDKEITEYRAALGEDSGVMGKLKAPPSETDELCMELAEGIVKSYRAFDISPKRAKYKAALQVAIGTAITEQLVVVTNEALGRK